MKAIGPAAAVAAPHSSVIAIPPSTRVRPTWAPSARPASSPSASAFNGRASASASSAPAIRNGATWASVSESRPASEPTHQKRHVSNASLSSSVIACVSASSAAVIAVPASASRTGVAPPRPAAASR